MIYRLIVLNGPLINQRITVEMVPMTIGRDPACAVCVPDEEMALRHALIEHRADGLYVRDLGSMNRILVNQREVREAKLKHGDILEVGRTQFLVQALVQADVDRGAGLRRRRVWRAVGGLVVVVLAVVWGANRCGQEVGFEQKSRSQLGEEIGATNRGEGSAQKAADSVSPGASTAQRPEELEKVREDLAAIRETVKTLSERMRVANDAPAPPVSLSEPASADRAREMFAEGVDAARKGRAAQADQLLAGAIALDPTLWPAYEERARLCERRGMPDLALRYWNDLIQRQPPPEVFERAVGERLRLSRAIRSGEVKAVRIVSAEQRKALNDGTLDELRVLKIGIQAQGRENLIEPERIKVLVDVYDEDVEKGQVEITSARVSPRVIVPSDGWRADTVNTMTVTYAVPRGARRTARYYGFVAQVFYNDRLQDVVAKPRDLLNLVRPARDQVSGGSDSS